MEYCQPAALILTLGTINWYQKHTRPDNIQCLLCISNRLDYQTRLVRNNSQHQRESSMLSTNNTKNLPTLASITIINSITQHSPLVPFNTTGKHHRLASLFDIIFRTTTKYFAHTNIHHNHPPPPFNILYTNIG